LPLVAVTAAFVVVVLAHRRARALGIVGFAIAVAGAVSLLVLWLAGDYVSAVPDSAVVRQLTAELYEAFLQLLVVQAALLIAVGLVLVVLSWFLGRSGRRRATARMLGPR
jgi:Ni,Fe-hydrogenase I cytochrome b subunit